MAGLLVLGGVETGPAAPRNEAFSLPGWAEAGCRLGPQQGSRLGTEGLGGLPPVTELAGSGAETGRSRPRCVDGQEGSSESVCLELEKALFIITSPEESHNSLEGESHKVKGPWGQFDVAWVPTPCWGPGNGSRQLLVKVIDPRQMIKSVSDSPMFGNIVKWSEVMVLGWGAKH